MHCVIPYHASARKSENVGTGGKNLPFGLRVWGMLWLGFSSSVITLGQAIDNFPHCKARNLRTVAFNLENSYNRAEDGI